jgi:type III secretion protein Q
MPLPFDLPALSRGFAELTPGARSAGHEIAAAASRALGAILGCDVVISARALPGRAAPGAAVARVALDLGALPGSAVLDVDAALVVALVDRLAGGAGAAASATALTPVEASALELFALAALDGACGVAGIEERLAPRLARAIVEPASPLVVELVVDAGGSRGRARLLVAPAAVRALRGDGAPAAPAAAAPVPASVRASSVALSDDERAALACGDVIVLDGPAEPVALVFPGGLRAAGRLADGAFHVEEAKMTDRQAQVPVTLEVELARVDVPLGELARLEPGAALPLAIDRRGLVTLRVGERLFGRGELVDVDGAVGVRILSLEVMP